MSQTIYWHALLWQVLIVGLVSLCIIGWLVFYAMRQPKLSISLAQIHSSLNHQPLFFYDPIQGITTINEGAEQILVDLSTSEYEAQLNVLADVLSETYTEGRTVYYTGWPAADQTIVATPLSQSTEHIEGVLGLITHEVFNQNQDLSEEPILAPTAQLSPEPSLDNTDWIYFGPTVRLDPVKPIAQVYRSNSNDIAEAWQEASLSHMEESLIRYLLENSGEVQVAEVLFSEIWGDAELNGMGLRAELKDRLRRLVYTLRQKVEPEPRNPRHICTAHGVGYVFYSDSVPTT